MDERVSPRHLDGVRRAFRSVQLLGLVACALGACGGQSFSEEDDAGFGGTPGASGVGGAASDVAGSGGSASDAAAAGTCPDTHATCCDTLTGESVPATCSSQSTRRMCASGTVMLWDALCPVDRDFACPSGPEVDGTSCAIVGAICEYPVGCGGRTSCRCEINAFAAPALGWSCTNAAAADCPK